MTYSKLIADNQQALIKQHIFDKNNVGMSLPFHKKFSHQNLNNEEMEIHSNPTFFYPNYDPNTAEEFQYYTTTLDRQVSDFGRQERHESCDRSMISGCSAKTFNTSGPCFTKVRHKGIRKRSTIHNNSSSRYRAESDNTDLSDKDTHVHTVANPVKGKTSVKKITKISTHNEKVLQQCKNENQQLKTEIKTMQCEISQLKMALQWMVKKYSHKVINEVRLFGINNVTLLYFVCGLLIHLTNR